MNTNINRRAIDTAIEHCRNREWQFTDDSASKARKKLAEYRDEQIESESDSEFDELADAAIAAALKADAEEIATQEAAR
jgi:hypothetical protein